MFDEGGGVVVAVSGGADSVALLEMLVRFRETLLKQSRAKKMKIHLAHLNHLLRGSESDKDAEFVGKLAETFSVAATIETADVSSFAKATGKGIEAAARELRYQFLSKVANEAGCNCIATGHTKSDQAETFVMRLVRGSGLRGLAAMRPVLAAHIFDEEENAPPSDSSLLLVRPLLCITREEVEAYCSERHLQFRTDTTNASLDYMRNRVRHETMVALRALNPKIVERIAQTAEIIASEDAAFAEIARRFLEQAKLSLPAWKKQKGDLPKGQAYSIAALLQQPLGLRRRMIFEAIEQAKANRGTRKFFKPRASQASEIQAVHITAVEKLLTESASGHRLILPDGLQVWREFDAVVFVYAFDEAIFHELVIDKDTSSVAIAGFEITLSRRQQSASLSEILAEARAEKSCGGSDWQIVALDDALLPEKLLIRPRQKGEVAMVLGQRKNIKLKKLMIDHKIAASRRANWPIVVTLDGEYVWSPGLPPALKFAANDKTTTLAILRASNV